ncbi:major facilitator transporter [Streptomyces alboflavus]|uniref:Major facilitator transporter n=1 Tax=Streptomyces alboflavus TaxID=67267 RepID=A0A1Z1W680_9ACTN|nr:MFS transporter [Streptomyces alboflavus]ARX81953.1 major facilitator transporter [Streptomyces alboflavus]
MPSEQEATTQEPPAQESSVQDPSAHDPSMHDPSVQDSSARTPSARESPAQPSGTRQAPAPDARPESAFRAPYSALTWGIVLSVGLVAFESMGVATVLPEIAGRLGGLNAYGWGLSALMLANLIGTVAAGVAADRHGPARPLTLGLAVFAVGCALAGAAPNWPAFLAGRFLQGLGVGAVMALAYTAIALAYPQHLRARMFALVSGAWTVPSLVGPSIAALISDHVSWRGVFVLLLPLIAAAATLALPQLRRLGRPGSAEEREAPAPAAEATPWWSTPVARSVLLAAGTGVLLAGLQLRQLALLIPLAAVGAATALLALRRVTPAGTLSVRRGVPTGVVLRFLLCGAYFGSEAFLPLGLVKLRELSATEAGLGLSAGAITWVLGATWQGRADSRWSGRSRAVPIAAGFAVLLVGIAVMALGVLVDAVPALTAVAGWAIGGAGMGVAFNAATTDAMEQATADRQGEASGSMQLAQTLAVAVLSGLGGAAVTLSAAHGGSVSLALTVTFALTAALTATGVLTAHRIRPSAA